MHDQCRTRESRKKCTIIYTKILIVVYAENRPSVAFPLVGIRVLVVLPLGAVVRADRRIDDVVEELALHLLALELHGLADLAEQIGIVVFPSGGTGLAGVLVGQAAAAYQAVLGIVVYEAGHDFVPEVLVNGCAEEWRVLL